jgi:hypothetical protein
MVGLLYHASTEHFLNVCTNRYKDVNVRLRRLVAEERKALQQLRATYAQELKTRTEMEVLLRKCVDDVRQDVAEM